MFSTVSDKFDYVDSILFCCAPKVVDLAVFTLARAASILDIIVLAAVVLSEVPTFIDAIAPEVIPASLIILAVFTKLTLIWLSLDPVDPTCKLSSVLVPSNNCYPLNSVVLDILVNSSFN